jgi:hypothetical protein
MVGLVEDSTRQPSLHDQQLVAALISVSTLEDLLDTLTAKVEEFDRRLCEAESRLESIVAEQH